MDEKKRYIVYIDGSTGDNGDWPIAVAYTRGESDAGGDNKQEFLVVDPVLTGSLTRNLYGRVMTLLEATTEVTRLKAVKDVFSKELQSWEGEVFASAREITKHGNSSTNLYNK